MEFLWIFVYLYLLMLPVGIVFLLLALFTSDNQKKAAYYSKGKKLVLWFLLSMALLLLVGFGLCFLYVGMLS